ncbi:MAG: hypothetical protein NUV75_02175 [Gallionella sp.]|nr:hypothetical protein [Gallionella sp.]
MKHLSYLTPHLPQPATPHAKECMAKIKEILAIPPAYEQPKPMPEREPGADFEEDDE